MKIALYALTPKGAEFGRRLADQLGADLFLPTSLVDGYGGVSFNLRSLDGVTSVRCTGRTDITDGQWHHVATVRDAARVGDRKTCSDVRC